MIEGKSDGAFEGNNIRDDDDKVEGEIVSSSVGMSLGISVRNSVSTFEGNNIGDDVSKLVKEIDESALVALKVELVRDNVKKLSVRDNGCEVLDRTHNA